MLIPPQDLPHDAARFRSQVRRLARAAMALVLTAMICFSASLSDNSAGYAGWLQLAAVLSAAGAVALLAAAAIKYRRHDSASLFRADSMAGSEPPVLWTAGKQPDP
jgi:hypothetical protein